MVPQPRHFVFWATIVVVLLSAGAVAWLASRFDPLWTAHRAYEKQDYRTALRAAQEYLKRRPEDFRASLMAARCLTRLGMTQHAETCYQRSGDLELEDQHDRAYGLARLGEARKAEEIYRRILHRQPDDLLALKRLAAMLMEQKNWKDARWVADQLVRIPGGEVWGWTLAGIAAHESKQAEAAAQAFEHVLQIDPKLEQMPLPQTLFWNNLALDLMALGQAARTREYLAQALATKDDDALMELLGVAFEQEGQLEEAERCWCKALSWNPDNADALIDLGRLALGRSQWNKAIELLLRAAALSPDALQPVYGLARAYRHTGNLAKALQYEHKAAELRRAHPHAGGMGESEVPLRRGAERGENQ
jgi:tetratricopeptide (TPR) repeat protein